MSRRSRIEIRSNDQTVAGPVRTISAVLGWAGLFFVAYYASAELGCHLALGWPMPARILDLYAEFRCQTNGLPTVAGHGLLGALAAYGLDTIGSVEKEEMRNLIMRDGPWSDQERDAILDYCESDVDALARLLPPMLPQVDLPRALLRGRYMGAAARMEWAGVPIDVETLTSFRAHWTDIQDALVNRIDVDYGVFDGRTFKAAKFAAWLERTGLAWPRLEVVTLICRTKLSEKPPGRTRKWLPCGSCGAPCRNCVSTTLLWAGTTGTGLSCRHSRRARVATNRATPNSFLAPAFGCAASSSRRQDMALHTSIGPSKSLG